MRERIKTYILLFLVVTSLLQIGILWSYQNHGFPIGFLSAFFVSRGSGIPGIDNITREEYFVPYRIIASNGNESHWVIRNGDLNFQNLWNDAKSCLKQILGSKQSPGMTSEDWGDLVTKRGLVFEFKASIRQDLLRWFLDMPEASSENMPGLHKMMIAQGFENNINVFLLDRDKVYRYTLPADAREGAGVGAGAGAGVGSGAGMGDFYAGLFAGLEKNEENKPQAYYVIREMDRSTRKLSSLSPDILCVTGERKYREYQDISVSVPEKVSDMDQMSSVIFRGNERDSYDRYEDSEGTIIFRNLDRIYRIYRDGLLEYKYLPGVDGTDKGSINAAFVRASEFVERVTMSLSPGDAGLYLSNVKENQGSYEFAFDYMINDIPVYFSPDGKEGAAGAGGNALVIEANGRRVLSCRWMVRSFKKISGASVYNLGFEEILNASNLRYNEVFIEEMGVSYVVGDGDAERQGPVFAITTSEGASHFVPIRKEQGE
jgi:hypothetical protein